MWQPGHRTVHVLRRCQASGETPTDELNAFIPCPIMESSNSRWVNGAGWKQSGGEIKWLVEGYGQWQGDFMPQID